MLDSGSFYNFITEKLVNKFKLNIQKKKKKKKKKKNHSQRYFKKNYQIRSICLAIFPN